MLSKIFSNSRTTCRVCSQIVEDGIFVNLVSDDGDANLFGQNVVSADNHSDGIEVYAEAGDAYNLDLGGGSLGSLGLNSWYGNGEYGVNNAGGGTVFALDNWWGVALPVSGTDYSAAGVDASNPLATDPN